ncbi:fibronectin type III domain-containing protein [Paenibacillus rhizoplanae]
MFKTFFSIPAVNASATDTSITLSWPSLFNADGYEVEFDKEVTVLGSEPYFTEGDLSPGTEHFYRIRAISGDIKGEWSITSSYWTLPAAPLNIQMNATSHTITLEWEPVIGASSYEIEVNNSTKNIGHVLTYQETDLNPNMPKSIPHPSGEQQRIRGMERSCFEDHSGWSAFQVTGDC